MEGQRVSHYEVLERLGGGGMGVVYRALDTKLDRHVALKFLPPELTRDEEARLRFIHEARAASALDHPNICTIYEIDATAEGQLFITMALYRGETLKKRIARGGISIDEACDIARQIARGLVKAHAAGIVHRDLKPANVMITEDGFVKIVDFGIAKLLGVTGITRTGSTLGTVAYMSPEQVNGEDVDGRSDVWSLGALLYEMLTGRQPFRADNEWGIIHAITSREPEPPHAARPDVPADVERVVMAALAKARDERPSADELRHALEQCRVAHARPSAAVGPGTGAGVARWAAPGVAAVAAALGGVWLFGVLGQDDRASVLEAAVPEIERLARDGQYDSAWVVADRVRQLAPDEPVLAELLPRFSWVLSGLRTNPSGARVLRRQYAAGEDVPWELVGTTPIDTLRLPFTSSLLRIEADGFRELLVAPWGIDEFTSDSGLPLLTLERTEEAPEEMVRVSGWRPTIAGEEHALGDFYIDRLEVTNREFRAFVDASGYRDPQYWEHPFVLEGRTLPRDEALARFTDETGRPGPSTWQAGTYPEGEDEHPVGGVSWYEAAAYAKYAGKELPSVHHWRRAYGTTFLMEDLIPRSNFQGTGTARVGSYSGIGPFGTFDMAGNVREWSYNAVDDNRYLLGGGWNDPDYVGVNSLNTQYVQPPFDRSPTNGIRLARYLDDASRLAAALSPLRRTATPDFRSLAPSVSDDVFEVYRRMYAYDRTALEPTVEDVDTARHWLRERISFNAAYGGERVLLYLYLPRTGSPPFHTVLLWPGLSVLTYTSIDRNPDLHTDFVIQSGRALAFPVLKGTLERRDGLALPMGSSVQRDRVIQRVRDVMRTLDYLETRPDVDASRLAYYGYSWGGAQAPIPLALEPRFKAAVLDVAGLSNGRPLPEADALTYLERVTLPVLMVNGRLDAVFPLDTHAEPFFDLLGTPPDRKRFVVSEAGHILPRVQLIRETLDWFDRYLGPVGGP